jgi:hypothetical protein
MQVSHKLVYIANKVINPIDDTLLLNQGRVKTALGGNGLFSFVAIKLGDKNTVLENIDVSTSSNFSSSKGIQPNVQLLFMGANSKSLDFFKNIPDEKFEQSALVINNQPIPTKADIDNLEFRSIDQSLIPENVVRFNSTLDNELIFLPQPMKGESSILDSLTNIYTTSFVDRFDKQSGFLIPSQTAYLLVFPFVSMPVPIPRNPLNVASGNIKINIILNFELREVG